MCIYIYIYTHAYTSLSLSLSIYIYIYMCVIQCVMIWYNIIVYSIAYHAKLCYTAYDTIWYSILGPMARPRKALASETPSNQLLLTTPIPWDPLSSLLNHARYELDYDVWHITHNGKLTLAYNRGSSRSISTLTANQESLQRYRGSLFQRWTNQPRELAKTSLCSELPRTRFSTYRV